MATTPLLSTERPEDPGGEKASEKTGLLHSHLPLDVRNQWYALALSSDIPRAKRGKVGAAAESPMSTSLLGDPLVLWRDLSGKAYCVADRCPHRSAPLSLGKVHDTGHLECIYHGWQIDGTSGKVIEIPALEEGKSIPSNAKVPHYPVFEQDGVVYVWPGSVEEALSASKPARDTDDSGAPLVESSSFVLQTLCIDLPIDHSLMVENLLDPAHVPFAHEGTIGNRKMVEPLHMTVTKTANGFFGRVKEGLRNGFEAPCNIVLYTPPIPGKMDLYQYIGCTPTAPGQMRMIYRAYRNFATFAEKIPPLKRLFDNMTKKIIFQDYQLLLGQQQRLRERALPWNSTIQVDCLPLAYRKYWQRTFGKRSDGPWWRGWDGKMDIEDLEKLGSWDKDFDCNGCALPRRPHHPQNPLEHSGAPGHALRPDYPASWR
ncbi:unnamed protein product [Durusdinium trenchii]|uniref:Rieske domain-containing protein n=1 Tax=Durusdinium trenchii TaxID=1381693 RepID=A0ABP0M778_9DINO